MRRRAYQLLPSFRGKLGAWIVGEFAKPPHVHMQLVSPEKMGAAGTPVSAFNSTARVRNVVTNDIAASEKLSRAPETEHVPLSRYRKLSSLQPSMTPIMH